MMSSRFAPERIDLFEPEHVEDISLFLSSNYATATDGDKLLTKHCFMLEMFHRTHFSSTE